MLNGQRITTPGTKKARNNSLTTLVLNLQRATAQELGLARQMSLRACDERWTLNGEQLAKIHEFASLYEEELAWSGDAKTGTGGLVAPASGWGEWKVTEPMPPASTSGAELQGQALYQLVSPSVFQVEAQSADGTIQGSAVAISRTDVLTNCHVVQGARKITLMQNKDKWTVQIGRSDPGTDRCVLRAENTKFLPIRGVRAYGDLKAGEPLLTLGSPSGLELTISNGILSGLREIRGQRFIQTTAPISPGSSGGGLFDSRGNLVGITTLTMPGEKKLNQSLNFAIASDLFWQQ
jgi:S1-C subfamily serine protease